MYGIAGAGAVWALRLIIEGVLLLFFAHRTIVPGSLKTPLLLIAAALTVMLMSVFLPTGWTKAGVCVAVLVGGAFLCWRFLLHQEERRQLALLLVQRNGVAR